MNDDKFLKIRFIFILLAVLGACTGRVAGPDAEGAPIAVVATTTIIADVVSNVAGDATAVRALLPPGSDPHRFDPSPNEARAIADADLVFMNGAGLDRFVLELVPFGTVSPTVVDLSEEIDLIGLAADADHGSEEHDPDADMDPHVWTNPQNVMLWTVRIASVLSAADPENAATYRTNAEAYLAELRSLDAWIDEQVSAIPVDMRKLVTDHDSLGYFVAKYDFTVVGFVVPGFSTLAQPSAQDMAGLIDTIRLAGVPVIFVDPSFNPSLADAVAKDAGVNVVRIYTGSLSPAGEPESSYLGLMRAMVAAIRENLGGN